jgi:transposase-like protein
MPQHFLLSAAARTLSLKAVMRMSEDEAREAFAKIRWHDRNGEPFCSRCGCVELYACKAENRWKCKGCGYRFSVTSGTIFASHKLPLRDLLMAIAIFVNGAKGYSALQLSRDLDVQYKTAFVLAHKIREALCAKRVSVWRIASLTAWRRGRSISEWPNTCEVMVRRCR